MRGSLAQKCPRKNPQARSPGNVVGRVCSPRINGHKSDAGWAMGNGPFWDLAAVGR